MCTVLPNRANANFPIFKSARHAQTVVRGVALYRVLAETVSNPNSYRYFSYYKHVIYAKQFHLANQAYCKLRWWCCFQLTTTSSPSPINALTRRCRRRCRCWNHVRCRAASSAHVVMVCVCACAGGDVILTAH